MNQTQRIPYSQRPEHVEPVRRNNQGQDPVVIRRHMTKGEKWLWLFSGAIVFLLAIGMVANQSKIFMISRETEQLQNKYAEQKKVNAQLESEEQRLSSPKRIMEFAQKELGLKLDINNIKVFP